MSTLKHASPGTYAQAIASAALTSGSKVVGDVIDNKTDLYLYTDVELVCTFASGPALNAPVDLHIVLSLDDTNYGTTSTMTVHSRVGTFNVINDTNSNTFMLFNIPIPAAKFKFVLVNNAGQNISTFTFKHRPHNLQV